MDWYGVHATGEDTFWGGKSYTSLSWEADSEYHGHGPLFLIRMPNGSIVAPNQITIEFLDANGAEILRQYEPNRARRRLRYRNGFMNVSFYVDKSLDAIYIRSPNGGIVHDSVPVSVISLDGSRTLLLPTTRDKLVEVFGEPAHEHISYPGRK